MLSAGGHSSAMFVVPSGSFLTIALLGDLARNGQDRCVLASSAEGKKDGKNVAVENERSRHGRGAVEAKNLTW